MVSDIMDKLNCYSKTINITARLLRGALNQDRNSIREPLTAKDIQTARIAQFIISMGPSFEAFNKGRLDSLRPFVSKGILYVRGRLRTQSMWEMLGIGELPVLVQGSPLSCGNPMHRTTACLQVMSLLEVDNVRG